MFGYKYTVQHTNANASESQPITKVTLANPVAIGETIVHEDFISKVVNIQHVNNGITVLYVERLSNDKIELKQKQAKMVSTQSKMMLRHTSLTEVEQEKAANDIADVILTSWDITEANVFAKGPSFGDTWVNKT